MMEPFPEKPKGMHWRTYERLWWKHHEAEMAQLIVRHLQDYEAQTSRS